MKRMGSLILAFIMVVLLCPLTVLVGSASSEFSITSPDDEGYISMDKKTKVQWSSSAGAGGYFIKAVKGTWSGSEFVKSEDLMKNTYTTRLYYSIPAANENCTVKIWVASMNDEVTTSEKNNGVCNFDKVLYSCIIYVVATEAPEITIGGNSNITSTSVSLTMTIDKNNGLPITDSGFYIGTSTSVANMTEYSFREYSTNQNAIGAISGKTVTMNITGLNPNTKYYYRAYAENDFDLEYSSYKYFKTESETSEVIGDMSYSVRSGGKLLSPETAIGDYDIDYVTGTTLEIQYQNIGYASVQLHINDNGTYTTLYFNRGVIDTTASATAKTVLIEIPFICNQTVDRYTNGEDFPVGSYCVELFFKKNQSDSEYESVKYYFTISKSLCNHTYTEEIYYETAHPHKEYNICSICGSIQYTGESLYCKMNGCEECYPDGNDREDWMNTLTEDGTFITLTNTFNKLADGKILDDKKDYVLKALRWYINEYKETGRGYRVARNIASKAGTPEGNAVFFFDGCSSNLEGVTGYGPTTGTLGSGYRKNGQSYNISAVCIVVKMDANGVAYVAYVTENASTMADNVRSTKTNSNGSPIAVDGVYGITFIVHAGGSYAYPGLWINSPITYRANSAVFNKETTVNQTINIHARGYSTNNVTSGSTSAAGCFNVGGCGTENFTTFTEYDNFIETVTGFAQARSNLTAGNGYAGYRTINGTTSLGFKMYSDAGCVIIDRSQYKDALADIYGDDTIETDGNDKPRTAEEIADIITEFSRNNWDAMGIDDDEIYEVHTDYEAPTVITWYAVSFDANGGSEAPTAMVVESGSTASLPSTVPSRSGYTFLGWSADKTATAPTYQAGGSIKVTANITLYAVWKIEKTIPATFTLSGVITSYNPQNATTVTLVQNGEVKYSTVIAAEEGSGKVQQFFNISGISAGTYDLVVTKVGHLTYTITDVVVSDTDIDLTASDKVYSVISLLAGDINGDGKITSDDINIIWKPTNYQKDVADSEAGSLADIDGSGTITSDDINIIWKPTNYQKGIEDCTVPY